MEANNAIKSDSTTSERRKRFHIDESSRSWVQYHVRSDFYRSFIRISRSTLFLLKLILIESSGSFTTPHNGSSVMNGPKPRILTRVVNDLKNSKFLIDEIFL